LKCAINEAVVELSVTSVDYAPRELDEQVPFKAKLLRLLPGPDRPDYWLGEVSPPLIWIKNNHRIEVSHMIVCARWQGTRIGPRVRDLPIGMAYVTDPSQLTDEAVHFEKCEYVAIGFAHEISEDESPPTPTDKIQAGSIAKAFGRGNS
jgi:hypothetical protein